MDTLKAVITYLSQIDIDTCILLATALAALYSIHRNTEINRRRATVDLVLHQKNDPELKEANKAVNPLLKSKDSIAIYADETHKDSPHRKHLLVVLNNYEFIASGMREDAFDLQLYKRMNYNVVLRDWQKFEPFIKQLRYLNSQFTLFQEFEWLAKEFKENPLKAYNKD